MVAVAALTYAQAHVNGLLDNILDTFARTESGHVRIRQAGYAERERFMPMHLYVRDLAHVLSVVRANARVREALPRIRAAVLVDGAESNRPGLLIGIDIQREDNGYLNPSAMVAEGRLPEPGQAEVLVGRDFADQLAVTVGDTITVLGQTVYRSLGGARLTVTGLAASGMAYWDNTIMIAPLDQVQAMADMEDGATEILVFSDDAANAEELAIALRQELADQETEDLEVVPWRDQSQLMRMIDTVRPILGFILGLLLLMAALIIVNTMLMTVMERTHEFGMQAALGMRRRDIVTLIIAEGLTIGLVGSLVGGAVGSTVGLWLESHGIDVTSATRALDLPFQGVLYPNWKPMYPLWAIVAGVVVAGIAALYPAWRAIRLAPAEALRS